MWSAAVWWRRFLLRSRSSKRAWRKKAPVAGMGVDVLLSGAKPGSDNSQGIITRTLLQNLEVLSAGQDFKKDAEGKPILVQVVNLLVTPDQAEQLSLASTN